MGIQALATALSVSRIAFGVAFIAAPAATSRSWIGARAARRPGTQVIVRALGARDLALGAGALAALRSNELGVARGWMTAHAISDGIDLLATLAARDRLPAAFAAFGIGMAGASTAIGAAAAARLGQGQA